MEPPEQAGWNPFARIAFRFCFVYFGLYCVIQPMFVLVLLGGMAFQLPTDLLMWQHTALGPGLAWVGRTVFGVDAAWHSSGSGDQTIDWVLEFCLLVFAVVVTAAWTALDRRRADYQRLAGWFLLFLRLSVAGQMLFYGFAKAIPTQMFEPGLSTLLQPYGNLAPFAVLWNQVGSSQPYEILLGCAEILGGLLLLVPRTAILGAMLSLVSMAQVFVLHMTFDVNVKLHSAHLMLMGLVLLAPHAKRLTEALVLDRQPGPATVPDPFRTPRSHRIAALVQVALALWISGSLAFFQWDGWRQYGSGRPKPPLYGIWTVQEFTRDGQPLPPLLTDENRWQRIVFDYPGIMEYQRMDGTLVPAALQVDTRAHRLELQTAPAPVTLRPVRPQQQPISVGAFIFQQPAPDRLRLEGEFNGHPVTVTLERFDADTFPQRSRGFHWVQDYGVS
ncbi:DoxX family protein [Nocardia sp. NPDC049149]|uniref:DoxX family protein n=1 Tax=Nocardia sp. NPDC049149 TaxID=3364315 RepID=UPI00371BEC13